MRRLSILTAVALIALVAGCSSPGPEPPERSSPVPSVFDSEEAAVAAAEKAFADYLSALNAVSQAGGDGVERLKPLVSDSSYEDVKVLATELKQNHHRQTGDIRYGEMEFQQSFKRADAEVVLVTACIDYSAREIVNAAGEPLQLLERPERTLFQVTFQVEQADENARLVVDDIESWNDQAC